MICSYVSYVSVSCFRINWLVLRYILWIDPLSLYLFEIDKTKHKSGLSKLMNKIYFCIQDARCNTNLLFIVSRDESLGYCAFVIVMRPPPWHRFFVWILHPTVLIQSFSNSGHMSLVPRSSCQSILGALQFHF